MSTPRQPRVIIFKAERRVRRGDQTVRLSPRPFELFVLLADANGRVLSDGYLGEALFAGSARAQDAVKCLANVLRSEVAPLGLNVERLREEGWFMKALGDRTITNEQEREDMEAVLAACLRFWNATETAVLEPGLDAKDRRTRDAAVWYLFRHCGWSHEKIALHFHRTTASIIGRIVGDMSSKPAGFLDILETFAQVVKQERWTVRKRAEEKRA